MKKRAAAGVSSCNIGRLRAFRLAWFRTWHAGEVERALGRQMRGAIYHVTVESKS